MRLSARRMLGLTVALLGATSFATEAARGFDHRTGDCPCEAAPGVAHSAVVPMPAPTPFAVDGTAPIGLGVATPVAPGWGGSWQPGGYEPRVGSPYYYRGGTSIPGDHGHYASSPGFYGYGAGTGNVDGYGSGHGYGAPGGVGPNVVGPGVVGPGIAGPGGFGPFGGAYGATGPIYGGVSGGDAYSTHFGPGFYRRAEYGHYRFPYYSYRAPWYHPGPPIYARDTNFPW